MGSDSEIDGVFEALQRGDPEALGRLLPLVYDELRRIAAAQMARERPNHTLQATALVHEAYLRLFGGGEHRWENRRHFFAAAAEAMRRILVESARRRGRLKRGGGLERVDLEGAATVAAEASEDLLDLDAALEALAAESPRKAELVKLRYFAGLTLEEAAECLDISRPTADRDWAFARAWLYERLGGPPDEG